MPLTAKRPSQELIDIVGALGRTIAIAEGFETAEAFDRLNHLPCWASLGARRLDQLIIPTSVTTLLIAEDNDPEGRRTAAKAEERCARQGLAIIRFPPSAKFKDFAKLLDARVWSGTSRMPSQTPP